RPHVRRNPGTQTHRIRRHHESAGRGAGRLEIGGRRYQLMSLKAQLEAIIYAAETPITFEQILDLVRESLATENDASEAEVRARVRIGLEELSTEYSTAEHGIEIRQVAGGYRMSTKPEQHDVVRSFAKSLKPPIRLSLPALETLAVIAYRQP